MSNKTSFEKYLREQLYNIPNNQKERIIARVVKKFSVLEQESIDEHVLAITKAWNIRGLRPDVHEEAKKHLRYNWTSLYYAIVNTIKK